MEKMQISIIVIIALNAFFGVLVCKDFSVFENLVATMLMFIALRVWQLDNKFFN